MQPMTGRSKCTEVKNEGLRNQPRKEKEQQNNRELQKKVVYARDDVKAETERGKIDEEKRRY